MARRVLGIGRLASAGLLVAALVAVYVAQALGGTGTGTAPILKNNLTCGLDNGGKAFGSVTFTRVDKTTLRTAVRLDKATPSIRYTVIIGDGTCADVLILGYFKTDSNGSGSRTFTSSTGPWMLTGSGYQSFNIFLFPETFPSSGVFGNSLTVKVDG